jgi:hypothetical protein
MINDSVNPFDDPIFKKAVISKEMGKDKDYELMLNGDDLDKVDDIEVIPPSDKPDSTSFSDLLDSVPKIPKVAKNVIVDASAIAKNQKEEKEQEMMTALSNVFTKYNQQYDTNLQIDFSNLSKTLINVADPEKRHTLELYVSEVFKSLKPVLLLHLISRLSLAMDYVLKPERMFDQSQLSIPDLFLVIEKLQEYIVNLNEIIKTSTIDDSDQILKKLAENKENSVMDNPESKQTIQDFMSLFKTESLSKKEE